MAYLTMLYKYIFCEVSDILCSGSKVVQQATPSNISSLSHDLHHLATIGSLVTLN